MPDHNHHHPPNQRLTGTTDIQCGSLNPASPSAAGASGKSGRLASCSLPREDAKQTQASDQPGNAESLKKESPPIGLQGSGILGGKGSILAWLWRLQMDPGEHPCPHPSQGAPKMRPARPRQEPESPREVATKRARIRVARVPPGTNPMRAAGRWLTMPSGSTGGKGSFGRHGESPG